MKAELLTISEADYHSNAFSKVPAYSNSIGKIIIAQSPLHAWMNHPLLNPAYEPIDSTKYDLGTACHAALLEGMDICTIIDADDWRTNAAKEARDEARKAGKIPMLKKDYPALAQMVDSANKAIANCKDLGGLTLANGKPEQTVVFEENGVLCKARLDWLSDDGNLCLDLKTSGIINPNAWMRSIGTSGYDMQDGFYKRAVKAISGKVPRFVFMVIETAAPYAAYFVELSPSWEAIANEKIAKALTIWQTCLAKSKWPAYPTSVLLAEPPAWNMAEAEEIAYDMKEFNPDIMFG